MELLYFIIGQNILWGIITFNFYKAANRQAWEAFIPFYNLFVALKIADRPIWWFVLFLVPVVGTIMSVVLVYEFLHVYNYRKTWQTVASVVTLGLYIGYLNFTEKLNYVGRDNAYIKANLGEFINAIFFAVVAATLIRSTTFEAYTIPTGSMEKSLLVGDFLFVSKMHYGVRIPMTPVSAPLIHNKIPFTDSKSYISFPSIPYFRLPAFDPIERNDIVVFNYPEEVWHPIDKKENYVKRCVGVAGDTISIVDRQVYIDGEPQTLPDRSLGMFQYYVKTKTAFNRTFLKEKFDLDYNNTQPSDVQLLRAPDNSASVEYLILIPTKKLEEFRKLDNVISVIPVNNKYDMTQEEIDSLPKNLVDYNNFMLSQQLLFPNPGGAHDRKLIFKNTTDNFTPLYIPKEGVTIELNRLNYYRYEKVITIYEGNELAVRDGKFYVNGKESSTYTFKQNYYWMMGDNRHNSLDSRFWGFVPEDHIVGKPVFIWMSLDWNDFAVRTDRVFTTVSGEGERRSYFFPVLIIAVAGWGLNKYLKKKKAAKNAA